MMNRRNFLKASLAGGAVTALNQIPVQATPTTSPAPDLMTDAVPEQVNLFWAYDVSLSPQSG